MMIAIPILAFIEMFIGGIYAINHLKDRDSILLFLIISCMCIAFIIASMNIAMR